mgnify:CR=1 FL=1
MNFMNEIVFLSESNAVSQSLFQKIKTEFDSRFQEINEQALKNIMQDKPKLIIVSVNYLYEFQQEIITSILMNVHDIPFVIYGDRETSHAYYQNTQSSVIGYIITPITEEKFVERLKTIWKGNIMEKKDSLRSSPVVKQNKRKILVVDDDPVCLRQMMNMLKNDYAVAVVKSGQDCLNYIEHEKVDLILLDFQMPQMNGAQTLKKIREYPNGKQIPVLFLTEVQDKEKVQEALASKPQGYLLKNSGNSSILKKISSFFGDI